MRSKAKISSIILLGFFCTVIQASAAFALSEENELDSLQGEIPGNIENLEPVKMDFLMGYYEQDGDHSAVTGGEGTESLKDFATIIKINIPLKKNKTLQFDSRLSYFTSASSDNINPNTISSASKNDFKVTMNASVSQELADLKKPLQKVNWMLGFSHEAHFASIRAGWGMEGKTMGKKTNQGEWDISASYTMDVWGQYYELSKLYPSDYRGPDNLETDKRHTLSAGLGFRQVVNSKLKIGWSAELIQQFGLLSTPFHRIYFSDTEDIDIERLPGYRLRVPLTGRVNWYAADWLIARSYYRFYWDNFKLKSHTLYFELPVKPVNQLAIYPFYRFHHQQGHQYFAEKDMHISTEEYYTSDFDQSNLTTHYYGGGFRWTPYIARRKKRQEGQNRLAFQAIEARGAYYHRSDGFHSWIISGGMSWNILRNKDKERPRLE